VLKIIWVCTKQHANQISLSVMQTSDLVKMFDHLWDLTSKKFDQISNKIENLEGNIAKLNSRIDEIQSKNTVNHTHNSYNFGEVNFENVVVPKLVEKVVEKLNPEISEKITEEFKNFDINFKKSIGLHSWDPSDNLIERINKKIELSQETTQENIERINKNIELSQETTQENIEEAMGVKNWKYQGNLIDQVFKRFDSAMGISFLHQKVGAYYNNEIKKIVEESQKNMFEKTIGIGKYDKSLKEEVKNLVEDSQTEILNRFDKATGVGKYDKSLKEQLIDAVSDSNTESQSIKEEILKEIRKK
jgi:prefoldin subunit 5